MVLSFALFSMFAASTSFLVSADRGKVIVGFFVWFLRVVLHAPFVAIQALPTPLRLCIELPVVVSFFIWFQLLMALERLVIRPLLQFVQSIRHPSGRGVSTVNIMDATFTPNNVFNHVDRFDLETALSLMNLSKLAYEDRALIADELERNGFDMRYFKVVKYYNTSAYLCVYKNDLIISFRGSEPLNLMHFITDFNGDLVDVASLDGLWFDGGKIHYGFLEALRLHRTDKPAGQGQAAHARRGSVQDLMSLRLDPQDSIGSAMRAVVTLFDFMYSSFRTAASRPMTMRMSSRRRRLTAFQQITDHLDFVDTNVPIDRIYVTGHSLGGALALVFMTQAICSSIPPRLTDKMHVYMYGAPRVGDPRFTAWMRENGCHDRIWKIVNAQDVVPRMPVLPDQAPNKIMTLPGPYAEAPGTTVHMHPIKRAGATAAAAEKRVDGKAGRKNGPSARHQSMSVKPSSDGWSTPVSNGHSHSHQGQGHGPGHGHGHGRRASAIPQLPPVEEESRGYTMRPDGSLQQVSLWSMSGLLSRDTLTQLQRPNKDTGALWMLLRIVVPFFLFDHLPTNYARVLKNLLQMEQLAQEKGGDRREEVLAGLRAQQQQRQHREQDDAASGRSNGVASAAKRKGSVTFGNGRQAYAMN